MKFVAVLKEKPIQVEILKKGGQYQVSIDDRKFAVDAIPSGPMAFSLLVDGHSCEVALEKHEDRYTAHFYDHAPEFAFSEARKFKAGELAKKATSTGPVKIMAPMPGKIVRIPVAENTAVQEGTPLVVMEAMKMQNEFRAPRAGTVKKIQVKEGDTVAAQQVLVILE